MSLPLLERWRLESNRYPGKEASRAVVVRSRRRRWEHRVIAAVLSRSRGGSKRFLKPKVTLSGPRRSHCQDGI